MPAVAHDQSLPRTQWRYDGGAVPTKVEPPRTGHADIIPFPVIRRHAFIERSSNCHHRMNGRSAINYLTRLIDAHAKRLASYGCDPVLIAADVAGFRRYTGMAIDPATGKTERETFEALELESVVTS
jgi:hypothetical protein